MEKFKKKVNMTSGSFTIDQIKKKEKMSSKKYLRSDLSLDKKKMSSKRSTKYSVGNSIVSSQKGPVSSRRRSSIQLNSLGELYGSKVKNSLLNN